MKTNNSINVMFYRLFLILLCLVIITHYIQVKRNLDQVSQSGHISTTLRFFEEVDQKGSSYVYSSEGMKIILPERVQAKIGQRLKIEGNVSRGKSVLPSLYSNEITLIHPTNSAFQGEENSGILLFAYFYEKMVKTRGKMVNFLHFSLPEPHSSIAAGMLLGERQQFDVDEKERLTTVGLMHVVAASGSNVIMVTTLFEEILRKRRGGAKFLLLVVCIWIYCGFAHFSATIVRASLMSTLRMLSRYVGREYIGVWALLLSGMAMLAVDPYLLFSLSFQLSMLASLAMSEVYPLLTKVFHSESIPGILENSKATLLSSTAVTLVSAPLLIYQFGSFSLISFASNVALLWLVEYIMMFAFFAIISAWIFPSYSSISVIPVWMCCEVWVRLVDLFARVPFASVEIPPFLGLLIVIPSGYAVFMLYRHAKYIL